VVVTNLSTRYRQTVARERALRSAFSEQRTETLEQNEAAVNYRILQQEIDTNRLLLEGMLQRSKENDAALAAMRNNIHVNDYAVIPSVPVGPKRLLFIAIAFALSLLLGVGVAVILGYFANSFRPTFELERTLNLRALEAGASGDGRSLSAQSGQDALTETNGDRRSLQKPVPAPNQPVPFSEAYRQLQTANLLSARRGLKSLLVTSSMLGQGRTMIAVNTALSLSQTGALVLLIDADLRKPRLHTVFDLNNEKGLTTILSNGFDERDPLRFIHHTERRVGVMTSGPVVENSAGLLSSDRMRKVIQSFEGIYDYVVIDSPPIAYFNDAVLLSSLADQVLLVVEGNNGTHNTVKQSYQLLEDAGANTIGVSINDARESKNGLRGYTDLSYAEAG
jgi:polysaccharide biosynthesis transport protein